MFDFVYLYKIWPIEGIFLFKVPVDIDIWSSEDLF